LLLRACAQQQLHKKRTSHEPYSGRPLVPAQCPSASQLQWPGER